MSDCADCGCDGDCQDTVLAKDANDPCQEGYEQYGMKTKNGRKVPNCVPIAEAKEMKKKYGEDQMENYCAVFQSHVEKPLGDLCKQVTRLLSLQGSGQDDPDGV